MNPLCVTCTFRTVMTHTPVQRIKHASRGRMPRTACPRMARHVFLLTYNKSTYPSVAPLALDVLSMPASEAYAERVFSVCLLAGETCRPKIRSVECSYR